MKIGGLERKIGAIRRFEDGGVQIRLVYGCPQTNSATIFSGPLPDYGDIVIDLTAEQVAQITEAGEKAE